MPLEGTVDIAIWLTIRSILLDTHVHGHIPENAGLIRPITIIAPKGCLANPTFPAPTIARFCPGNQLADTVMKALSGAMPRQVSAGIGNLKVIAFSGLKDETHWVHMEIFEGCYGGRSARTAWTPSTRSTPTPATTRSRTSRPTCRCACCATSCARTWPAPASGAAAWARCASSPSSPTAAPRSRAKAIATGRGASWAAAKACRPSSTWCRATAQRALPSKVPHMNIAKDGRFICYGPAGGGYGNPLERDPKKVADDVLDGVISVETALRDYKVVVSAKGVVDEAATAKLRAAG